MQGFILTQTVACMYAGTQKQHWGVVVVVEKQSEKKQQHKTKHAFQSELRDDKSTRELELDFCVSELCLNENQNEKGATQSVTNGLGRQTIQKGPPQRDGRGVFDMFRDAEVRGSVVS